LVCVSENDSLADIELVAVVWALVLMCCCYSKPLLGFEIVVGFWDIQLAGHGQMHLTVNRPVLETTALSKANNRKKTRANWCSILLVQLGHRYWRSLQFSCGPPIQ